MKVHIFGAASSPGCANYGLKQTASDNQDKFGKRAAEFIRNDFYVDDGLISVEAEQEAIEIVENSRKICAEGGLHLHKFISNSKSVIESIPPKDRAPVLQDRDMAFDSLPVERALGVQWCIQSDTFQFRIVLQEKPFTRRGILSTVCSVFDPLGFLAPVLLMGKQLLQQMCKDNAAWDDPLPDEMRNTWTQWRSSLLLLQDLKIQRCVKPKEFGKVVTSELHHFSDASVTGYGQCSYLRQIDDAGRVHCAFVMGKARVAPLKPITVPRLELTAAVVSVKVGEFLKRELKLENISQFYWTDSRIVLGYVANDVKRFHIFVANRIQQIRDVSSPSQWFYISTHDNPADIASRGCDGNGLTTSSLWFQGPTFLWKAHFSTDKEAKPKCDLNPGDPEIRKATVAAANTGILPKELESERISVFSDWHQTKRAVATCLWLKTKLKLKAIAKKSDSSDETSSYSGVHVADLHSAEKAIIRIVQRETFPEEIKTLDSESITGAQEGSFVKKSSALYRLDPFLDEDGILRVGGRLRRSSLSYTCKHPAVLLRHHHISTIIIRYFHERVNHQGRGMTINAIRNHGYWILGLSSAVTQLISQCVTCRKLYKSPQGQKMADLPTDRTECSPPFTYCAVDLFGPWYVKERRSMLKRYGVLFTCMVSRAIHIETANSLETSSFINALRRFISLRGQIRQLRSDCGTNFVGAARELKEAFEEMDHSAVKEFLLKQSCDYVKFVRNVPSASHMGGVWERQIRTVRRVLSGLLRDVGSHLDDESLRTFMHEAAATVNSRPLTYQNLNDVSSLEPLTPNHLLTMKTNIILPPPGKFQRTDLYCRRRWRRVQHCANEFWYRWRREYLQALQPRPKWNLPQRDLKVGDVVVVKDDDIPRNQWCLGRIHETSVDEDGRVRKVMVAIGNSSLNSKGERPVPIAFLHRPIHKLVLLLETE